MDLARRTFLRGGFARGRESGGRGLAVLDRGACVAWKGVICMSCRLACEDRAVLVDSRQRPRIDAEACTGCGACVDVCPPGAIRGADRP